MSDFTRIQLRRSESNEWTSSNPVLQSGEAGYELDTKRLKIGDGISPWSSLDYIRIHPSSITFPSVYLDIGDGYDQRMSIDLSSAQLLNIRGSGDTIVTYDNDTKTLIFDTQIGNTSFTKNGIVNALGYVPQPTGFYSLSNHNHSISSITGLQESLNSKQPSGNYSTTNHSHQLRIAVTDNQILNYNTNDILNIIGSGLTSVYMDDYTNTLIINSIGNSGVTLFNNRSGNIQLNFIDVTGALGYVPQPVGNYMIRNISEKTLSSPNSSGNPGDMHYDDNYLYVCLNTNFWGRFSRNSWL